MNNDLLKQSKDLIEKLSSELEKMIEQNKKVIEQNNELLQENKTWNIVSNSDDLIGMDEVAKALNYKGYGRNKIFELLRDKEILRHNNHPYQKYVDDGYFKLLEEEYDNGYGQIKIYLKTVVTQKGLDFIRRKLDESNN